MTYPPTRGAIEVVADLRQRVQDVEAFLELPLLVLEPPDDDDHPVVEELAAELDQRDHYKTIIRLRSFLAFRGFLYFHLVVEFLNGVFSLFAGTFTVFIEYLCFLGL